MGTVGTALSAGLAELAGKLWAARRDGGIVDPDQVTAPQTDAEAYAVQWEIARLSGAAVKGFKVGSTSREAQRILGTNEPGSGPVLAPYLYDSPARIELEAEHLPSIEGEFAFRLAKDLPAKEAGYDEVDVREAICAVAGAIEVVGSRLKGGLAGKGRLLVTADGGANIALAVGPWREDWQALDLAGHKVSVSVNGEEKGSGTGAAALGHPILVMVWLANQQARMGRGLKAGDIVSTGTCTGIAAVRPGDSAVADFGQLGRVKIAFE
jgi:2-keto-4-pentenoate hydratase